MEFYELTYIVEKDAQERLSALAERYKKINGWKEREILQFAVVATSNTDIELKLQFLEEYIVHLEEYSQSTKGNQNEQKF